MTRPSPRVVTVGYQRPWAMFWTSVKVFVEGSNARRFRLSVKRVVLQRAANDERPSVGQHHHAVAEHVPGDGLGGEGAGDRIPDRRPQVRIRRIVARARNHQDLSVVHQRHMNGIDRHEIRQGSPLSVDVCLCCRLRSGDGKDQQQHCCARKAGLEGATFQGRTSLLGQSSARESRTQQN